MSKREWHDLIVPQATEIEAKFIAAADIVAVGTDPDNRDIAVVVDLTQTGDTVPIRGVLTMTHAEANLLVRSINSTLRGVAQGN